MSFVSYQFLLFFPIVTGLYFVLPQRFRWLLLLTASCIFYAAFIPGYLLILFALIAIDYFVGIRLEQAVGRARVYWLLVSIFSTCIALFTFKYFDFFATNANSIGSFFHIPGSIPLLHLLLPIGLSFHTFQSLAYVFEIYKGRFTAERNLGIFALYVMFYPQLVAGPIERPQNLLHQFREVHLFDRYRLFEGLKRMAVGFVKKTLIADNLAIYVNQVYARPHEFPGYVLLLATLFFTIQIYCDFSGYSDIAIGSARSMGFTLMENFKNPYFAASLADFWRRWHISLSTWFRDYIYIPLGGNRASSLRWSFNILLTFSISGLWHGANWTYLLWGCFHGLYLIVERALDAIMASIFSDLRTFFSAVYAVAKRCIALCIVVLSWAFFRSSGLSDASYIIKHSVVDTGEAALGFLFAHSHVAFAKSILTSILAPLLLLNMGRKEMVLFGAVIVLFLAMEWVDSRYGLVNWVNARSTLVRWSLYAAAILAVANLGATNELAFIYFQF